MDVVVLSSALVASSVMIAISGNKLRMPGGVELKGNTEDLLARTGKRFGNEMTQSILKKKLIQANLDMQPEYFSGLQIALPVLTSLLFVPLSLFGLLDIYWAILPTVLTYFIPGVWLNSKVKQRITKIKADIPDFCVMLGNALSSGADLLLALEQVSGTMEGELAGEIRKALIDMNTGDSRAIALNKMANRCGISELTGLVRKIQQAIRYGSPLEPVVMHHAEKMMDRQKHNAQKTAGELTIRLLFPIIIFILLPLFIFLGFPVAWNVLKAF